MSRRRSSYSSYSSSYYKRDRERRLPSPLPYFLVALLAAGGLAYFHVLVFKSLHGKVTNAYTGGPMPGIMLSVTSAPTDTATPPLTTTSR